MSAVWAAIITGICTLAGTVITVLATTSKTQKKIEVNQAVTKTQIEELTREVRLHNNFAQRMPVVEEKIESCERRLSCLEEKKK